MFFDFLKDIEGYNGNMVARMNLRHRFLIDPFKADLGGARVLDVAAHDGRWSYALAAAGAREVIGVEARRQSIMQFAAFPPKPFKRRVRFNHNDLFRAFDTLARGQERFDVVALFGILYHVTDHYGLLARAAMLQPKLIIVDSEFITDDTARIHLVKERTDGELNATSHLPRQDVTLVGIPTTGAIDRMAEVLGYQSEWLDWDAVPQAERRGVQDYYREGKKRRRTCVLRPTPQGVV